MTKETVIVGLSGGVDSAVTAWLLKKKGYHVIGLFMKNWEDDDDNEYCASRQDFIDAAAAADVIGIDLEAVNFAKDYKERVFSQFLSEYQAGRTPNPDILCNAEIKFRAFLDHAITLGAHRIATGHYAQVYTTGKYHYLLKGVDPSKDQTYFLHRLNQEQLSKVLFPIGHLYKTQVRDLAKIAQLPNAEKKDSTGICFIGERPFRAFLNRYIPSQPGPIATLDGRQIGEHMGLMFYTLGQRKGLGIGGVKGAAEGEAWFVARKDLATNTLIVVQGHTHPALLNHDVFAANVSWTTGEMPDITSGPIAVTGKTRYRQQDAACHIMASGHDKIYVRFVDPQWAVTPGQSIVLYQHTICLGGGVIDLLPEQEAVGTL